MSPTILPPEMPHNNPLSERSPLHPEALNAGDLRVGMMIMCSEGFPRDPATFYLVLGLPYMDAAGDTRALLFHTYHPRKDTDPVAVRRHPGYGVLAADYWLNSMGLAPHPAIGTRPAYWSSYSYAVLCMSP